MKKTLLILILAFCTPVLSADKISHEHGNRSHSHILPAQGVYHTHNGSKPKSQSNQENMSNVLDAINSVVVACFIFSSEAADKMAKISKDTVMEEDMNKFAIKHRVNLNKLCLQNAAFKLNQVAEVVE